MSRLGCVLLGFVLLYQCVGVVHSAVDSTSLPSFVGEKEKLFENLKSICSKSHNTKVIAEVDLPNCRVTCSASTWSWIFGGSSEVLLKSREPCSKDGGICVQGTCAYEE
uniref:Putative ixodes 8-cys protein n=1 Tax=Ixodes ricinus TaxID=34613 RepID=A0A0K8RCQ0_IXORI